LRGQGDEEKPANQPQVGEEKIKDRGNQVKHVVLQMGVTGYARWYWDKKIKMGIYY
jgi:hypothetical protein